MILLEVIIWAVLFFVIILMLKLYFQLKQFNILTSRKVFKMGLQTKFKGRKL